VALQRSMLRIVRESPEVAYAHPRFWAPFLVAGDGGRSVVAPSAETLRRTPLTTRWERNLGEKLYGEILVVDSGEGDVAYAMGISEPNNDRAKSVVVALDSSGGERWRVEDPVVAAGAELLRYAEGRVAASGNIWSTDRYEGAVLRAFDTQTGSELWRLVIDS